jgi:hypothetical protein
METLPNSTDRNLSESISSPPASPARISARPESALVLRDLVAAFGLKQPELLGHFDPDGYCWRMSQASLLCPEQWEPLQGSWPDSAMWDSTSVYALRTSARVTSGRGCSSWPTPDANSGERYGQNPGRLNPERTFTINDAARVFHWPTARAEDSESAGNHPGAMYSLTGATRNWATPQAHDQRGAKTPEQIQAQREKTGAGVRNLNEEASTWATPQAFDSTECVKGLEAKTYDRNRRAMGGIGGPSRNLREEVMDFHPSLPAPPIPDGQQSSENAPTSRRRLNPRFVEWLMGFPLSWSEV